MTLDASRSSLAEVVSSVRAESHGYQAVTRRHVGREVRRRRTGRAAL